VGRTLILPDYGVPDASVSSGFNPPGSTAWWCTCTPRPAGFPTSTRSGSSRPP